MTYIKRIGPFELLVAGFRFIIIMNPVIGISNTNTTALERSVANSTWGLSAFCTREIITRGSNNVKTI